MKTKKAIQFNANQASSDLLWNLVKAPDSYEIKVDEFTVVVGVECTELASKTKSPKGAIPISEYFLSIMKESDNKVHWKHIQLTLNIDIFLGELFVRNLAQVSTDYKVNLKGTSGFVLGNKMLSWNECSENININLPTVDNQECDEDIAQSAFAYALRAGELAKMDNDKVIEGLARLFNL